MSTLRTPKEFDEAWAQVEPDVAKIIAEALLRSPVASAIDPKSTALRSRCMMMAFDEIYEFLQGARLNMFVKLPDWLIYENDVQTLLALTRRLVRYKSCHDETLTVDTYAHPMKLLRINAQAWFENPEFVRWLNRKGTATWHSGGKPGEYSDVFFTFCQGDGSDYPSSHDRPGIPEEIWRHLEIVVAEQFNWDAEVLVWVSNLS